MMSLLSDLECTACEARQDADALATRCDCGGVLYPRYDLETARRTLDRAQVETRPPGLWRLAELMPLRDPAHVVTLGEAGTPLRRSCRAARSLGLETLWLKDETLNPTGSFKARGLAAAVSRARELGVERGVIPTAGNAGVAFAAYAAAAGMPATVTMPPSAAEIHKQEVRAYGAELELVDGSIADAGRRAAEIARATGAFNFATLAEPYRVEGKKTMGYELWWQLGRLPDVIVYPTGGGTGLVGMWKAFEELEALGWVGSERPRMVSVQAAGCAPVVRAWQAGDEATEAWAEPDTAAEGLRVPTPLGGPLMLRALRESDGEAVAVSEQELVAGCRRLAREEGLLVSLEAGAALAALERLLASELVARDETVVIFLTGAGYRHLDAIVG